MPLKSLQKYGFFKHKAKREMVKAKGPVKVGAGKRKVETEMTKSFSLLAFLLFAQNDAGLVLLRQIPHMSYNSPIRLN